MHKLSSYLLLISLLYSSRILGNDTLLTKVFTYNESIGTIANDSNGNIFASFSTGVYYVDGDSGATRLYDSDFNGHIFFLDSLYYEKCHCEYDVQVKISNLKQSYLSWLDQLPSSDLHPMPTVAVDSSSNFYVATDYHIYKFKVLHSFDRSLRGHSVRGIAFWNKDFYYNTYDGLFKGAKVLDTCIIGGTLYQNSSGQLYVTEGPNLYSIKDRGIQRLTLSEDIIGLEDGDGPNITQIIQTPESDWLIGTTNGLAIRTPDNISYLLKGSCIEGITPAKNGFILSTSEDIVLLTKDYKAKPYGLPKYYYNQTIAHGNALITATDQGLFLFDTKNRSMIPLLQSLQVDKPIKAQNIIKDKSGFLWCGTNYGLYHIDLSDYSFQSYLEKVDFNKRSLFQNDGTIYMGSISGVHSWKPNDFHKLTNSDASKSDTIATLAPSYPNGLIISILTATAIGLLTIAVFISKRHLKSQDSPPLINNLPSSFETQIDDYINQNIHNVTVDTICAHFDITKRELYRKLKHLLLPSPGQLIREKRQELIFKVLDTNPETDIETLANMVGYSKRHVQNILDSHNTIESGTSSK